MTLILSATGAAGVCQVSDRLLTLRASGSRYDELANKNLIYLARDGILTLGYTGLAYLDGVPTDRWIARKLALNELLQGDGQGAVETGFDRSRRWIDIGLAMLHLARELTRFSQKGVVPDIQIFGTGFQWGASGPRWRFEVSRPVIWEIRRRKTGPTFDALFFERHWGWEEGRINLAVLPRGYVSDERFSMLSRRVAGASSMAVVIDHMVDCLREVAGEAPAVGADCMTIVIPSPKTSRTVASRYVPSSGSQGEARSQVFTPWVVAPQAIVFPTILNGFDMEVPDARFTFRFEGPSDLHVREDGSIVIFRSQPRLSAPS